MVLMGDTPAPADYDGDGAIDIANFRNGLWSIDGMGTELLGQNGDVPLPRDYDGDGLVDFAVYRFDTYGQWIIRKSSDDQLMEGSPPILGESGDAPIGGRY